MSEPDLLTLLATETLGDFTCENVTLLGVSKPVYRIGSGPAVIVMSEMPGIYHHVARFARFVRDAGFSVWMPHLLGTIGAMPTPEQFRSTMARVHQSGIPRVGVRQFESDRRVAARARGARPCDLRRQRRRRDRHVFHR
jgi:dienelactone hydrolase